MNAEMISGQLRDFARSFFFPPNPKCAVCSKVLFSGNVPFCKTCAAKLVPMKSVPHCLRCGNPLASDSAHCSRCERLPDISQGISLYLYDETCREIVHDFKYRKNPNGASSCGTLLAQKILTRPWLSEIDEIVPVPANEKTFLSRGYNQSERIADAIGDKCDIIVNNYILSKKSDARDQTELDREQRIINAFQSYEMNQPTDCTGKTFLLIDDVITTGSTIGALSRILMEMGAKAIYFATFATASEDN
jgi:ComF family protein